MAAQASPPSRASPLSPASRHRGRGRYRQHRRTADIASIGIVAGYLGQIPCDLWPTPCDLGQITCYLRPIPCYLGQSMLALYDLSGGRSIKADPLLFTADPLLFRADPLPLMAEHVTLHFFWAPLVFFLGHLAGLLIFVLGHPPGKYHWLCNIWLIFFLGHRLYFFWGTWQMQLVLQ